MSILLGAMLSMFSNNTTGAPTANKILYGISKYFTAIQVVNQRELNGYVSKENKQTSYEKLAPWGNCIRMAHLGGMTNH